MLRIATAYGLSPRMRFDLTVSQFAWELATGRPLQVYDADTWRPYCHVRDICKAIMTVARPARRASSAAKSSTSATPPSSSRSAWSSTRSGGTCGDVSGHLRGQGLRPAQLPRVLREDRKTAGFPLRYTVQDYLPRLTAAVQAGIFPDVSADPRFGNYKVIHGEADTTELPATISVLWSG